MAYAHENFERKWLTPQEEIKQLSDKKQKGSFSDTEEKRLEDLKTRLQEQKREEPQEQTEKRLKKEDSSIRQPGQEGYL